MTRFWKLLLAAGLLGPLALPAQARDKDDKAGKIADEDEEDESELPRSAPAPVELDKPVVEVARGFYMQADPGSFDYLGLVATPGFQNPFGDGLSWGNSIRLHVGTDLMTQDRFGLSTELSFWQVVNRGAYGLDYTTGYVPTQGATRSFLYEISLRPTALIGSARRINVYGRVGAGVGFLQKAREIEEVDGLYSSFSTGLAPKPFVSGGVGIEYYTRLSHFSFTFIEVNALYFLGLDVGLAINFAGFKYTF